MNALPPPFGFLYFVGRAGRREWQNTAPCICERLRFNIDTLLAKVVDDFLTDDGRAVQSIGQTNLVEMPEKMDSFQRCDGGKAALLIHHEGIFSPPGTP